MNAVVLFQGQGSYGTYYVRSLLDKKKELNMLWKRAERVLGWSVLDLLHKTENSGTLPTDQAQPLIFLMEYTAWCAYKDELKSVPKYFAGHSLGELVALTASKTISFEDAIRLVKVRGNLMQNARNGIEQGMMALQGCSPQEAMNICKNAVKVTGANVYCANYNSRSQTIVGGERKALIYITEHAGVLTHMLPVTKAFHTPFMKEAAEKFKDTLKQISFAAPQIPVLSNVTAMPYQASWSIEDLLYRQIVSPVNWIKIMDYLSTQGIMVFLQATNSKLFRNMDSKVSAQQQWGSLEDAVKEKIYDFDSLYFSENVIEEGGTDLCGEILKCMLSNPWLDKPSDSDMKRAEKAYSKVVNWSKQRENTVEEIKEGMESLHTVLLLKGISDKDAFNECVQILEKYGIRLDNVK